VLTDIDPVEKADAIYVLGGSWATRTLEAAALYRDGAAPRIFLSPGGRDFGELELILQGFHPPNEADIERSVLVDHFNVPASAVTILPGAMDNTAQEAEGVRQLAHVLHWSRLIVVTDRSSSRRVGYAFRRIFGDRLKIIVTCNRDDPYDPARWWVSRDSLRATMSEVPKLIAYWGGLRG
jgi:uncharacterized SAM-binding protein YcdF (DUF218 family)